MISKQLCRTFLSCQTNLYNTHNYTLNIKGLFSKFDCKNCHKILTVPECKACDKMVNYFQIFKIPSEYKIDPIIIKQMARDLQKQFHPDKYNQNSAISLQQKMLKYSSYINQAKATLLNDLQRAIYLMQLKGVVINEQIQIKESGFMMQIFEINEEIESANLNQIQSIKKRLETVIDELQLGLEDFFKSDDMKKCKEFIIKYKYIHRALLNAKLKMQRLREEKNKQ